MGNLFTSKEEACNKAMEYSKADRFKATHYVMKKAGQYIITVNEMLIYQLRKQRWTTVEAYKNGMPLMG